MSQALAEQAGSAFFWKGLQLAGNKLIFLVRTIILARILAPEDFGLMAIALVAVGFLTGITELGMIPALVQSSQVDEKTYNTAWTVGMLRAIVITAVVYAAAPLIALAFAEPRATDLIRVAAFRPILDAAASIKVARLTRELRFRPITVLRLVDALVNTILSILLAPRLGVWALIAGTLAGQAAYLLTSYLLAPHLPRILFDRAALKSLVNFGQWIFLTSAIVVVGSSLLQLIISRSLGVAELGIYTLATRLAFIPYEISSEVIGAVAFPLYARLQTELEQARRVFRSILTGVWAAVTPVSLLLIALAPVIVSEVLGPKWDGTAPVIRLLAIVNVITLFGDSVSPVLKGLGQPNKVTVMEAFQYTLLLSLIWSLTKQFGISGAALGWLIAGGLTQIVAFWLTRPILDRPLASLLKPLSLLTLTSILGASLALGITAVLPGLTGFILAGFSGGMLIVFLTWLFDRTFNLQLARDITRAFPRLAGLIHLSTNKP